MVDALLDFMLGPLRAISKFYIEYQEIINPIIVGIAFWKVIKDKKKNDISNQSKEKDNIVEG